VGALATATEIDICAAFARDQTVVRGFMP
jgi:hypothetical protein